MAAASNPCWTYNEEFQVALRIEAFANLDVGSSSYN